MAKHGAVPDERGDGASGGGEHRRGESRARDAAPLRTVRGKAKSEGPLALDRLIHERIRLAKTRVGDHHFFGVDMLSGQRAHHHRIRE